jgi:hypothetical protein
VKIVTERHPPASLLIATYTTTTATMMSHFTTSQKYDVKIISNNAHRSKLGFAVRRVRVIGSVEGGRLPFVDISDGNKEKAVYLTNILEVDGVPTGNRPARDDGPALRKGDYVLVDRAVTKDGTTTATVAEVVDRYTVHLKALIGGKMLRDIPRTHVRQTTQRKLLGCNKTIRKSRRVQP